MFIDDRISIDIYLLCWTGNFEVNPQDSHFDVMCKGVKSFTVIVATVATLVGFSHAFCWVYVRKNLQFWCERL